MEYCREKLSKLSNFLSRSPYREANAEFLGTLFFVLCGQGVMACVTLCRMEQSAALFSAVGWGLALMVGVALSGATSGAHLNPAITLAFAIMNKCSWKKVLPYIFSQYNGSFTATFLLFSVYKDAINDFDGGIRQLPPNSNSTAEIFATYPKEFASIGSCLLDQVVGTAMLMLVICAAFDERNRLPLTVQAPVMGLGLTAISLAFGYNCGCALNPARDFAPRMFTAFSGWGINTLGYRNYMWFWIPIVGPHIGALMGAWIYAFLIEMPWRRYELLMEEQGEISCHEREEIERIVETSEEDVLERQPTEGSLTSELSGKISLGEGSLEEEPPMDVVVEK